MYWTKKNRISFMEIAVFLNIKMVWLIAYFELQ